MINEIRGDVMRFKFLIGTDKKEKQKRSLCLAVNAKNEESAYQKIKNYLNNGWIVFDFWEVENDNR